MLRIPPCYNASAQLIAVVAVFSCMVDPAVAQVKPYRMTGGGVADFIPGVPGDTAGHIAYGTATGLGRYSGGAGETPIFKLLSLDFLSPELVTPVPGLGVHVASGTFSSENPFVFTAANGDRLVCSYGHPQPGVVNIYLQPQSGMFVAVFKADWNPVVGQSTGRFAKIVGGSFHVVATTGPFIPKIPGLPFTTDVPYSWVGSGSLEYVNPGKGK